MRFLKYLAVSWAVNFVVLGIVCAVLGGVNVSTFGSLLFAAAVFGVLNTILKPILRLLTLPFAVITLGLVWFAVSMLMLWLTSVIVPGFNIHGFWTYVWATVAVWAVNVVIDLGDYFLRRGSAGRPAAAH